MLGSLGELQLCELILEFHLQTVVADLDLVFDLMQVHGVFKFDKLVTNAIFANVLSVQFLVGFIQRLEFHFEPTDLSEECGLHICNARVQGRIGVQ